MKITKNYTAEKGPTFRYVRYRILRPLLKLNYKMFRRGRTDSPWLAQGATIFLDQYLTKEMRVLEYGSGYSTIYFANRVDSVVSFEHYKEWYDRISKEFAALKLTNIDYQFVPPNDPATFSEERFRTAHPELKGFELSRRFSDYFEGINSYPDESFDLILIDGRARVETFFNAFPKLKKGGLAILDNSERDRYDPIHEKMKDCKKQSFTTGLTDTVIWVKS